MTANGVSFRRDKNVLKLVVMVAQPVNILIENIKLRTLNCVVCDLYLDNAVLKKSYEASTTSYTSAAVGLGAWSETGEGWQGVFPGVSDS